MYIEITDISDCLTTAAPGFCGPVLVSRDSHAGKPDSAFMFSESTECREALIDDYDQP